MSKIIVGVDESPGSTDAIALASSLAGITGATLMLVNVFPYDTHPSRAVNADFENFMREDSEELLERLRAAHGDDTAEVKAIAEPSPPRGLHELAEHEDAGLIVVGSTHTGRAGRVLPGSTAERLLHGSPCPVAVAPKDYAHRTLGAPGIIGCGYDGTPAADGALAVAHRLAAATGARLRVIRAFQPLATVPQRGVAMGHAAYNDTLKEQAAERARRRRREARGRPSRRAVLRRRRPCRHPRRGVRATSTCWSSAPAATARCTAVLVGGVAGRVVREAACPVIVLPRKAGHVAGGLAVRLGGASRPRLVP